MEDEAEEVVEESLAETRIIVAREGTAIMVVVLEVVVVEVEVEEEVGVLEEEEAHQVSTGPTTDDSKDLETPD